MRLLLALLTGAAFATAVPRIAPVPKPDPVMHPAVRAVLDTKMDAHAIEMTDLVMLVVLLEREDAAAAAERIASEPRVGRALDRSDASAGLPDDFFQYQKDLSARASELAVVARDGSDREMSDAFGRLTGACVSCHARYLTRE